MGLKCVFFGFIIKSLLVFSQPTHSSLDAKHMISTRCLAYPNQGRNHFAQIFWSSHEYLIHHQRADLRAY